MAKSSSAVTSQRLLLPVFALLLGTISLGSRPLWAGTQVKAHMENVTYPDAQVEITASIGKGRLRLDFKAPKGEGSVIYNQKTSTVILVDDIHKTVLPITQAEQSTLKMAGAFAADKIMEGLAKSDPDTQKIISTVKKDAKALVNGRSDLRKKGVQKAGFTCDLYQTDLEGKKAREVWMASPAKAGMAGEDYDTFLNLANLVLDLVGGELFSLGADTDAFRRGFSTARLPVFEVLYAGPNPSSRFQVQSVQAWTVDPDAFNPPAGYQVRNLTQMIKQGMAPKP